MHFISKFLKEDSRVRKSFLSWTTGSRSFSPKNSHRPEDKYLNEEGGELIPRVVFMVAGRPERSW